MHPLYPDMSDEMAKEYLPHRVESSWDAWWSGSGFYSADPESKREKFVMVIPPVCFDQSIMPQR